MKRLLLSCLMMISLFALNPAFASASGFFNNTDYCNQAPQSAVCADRSNAVAQNGPNALLGKVTSFIALIAGFAAVIVIIISGLRYIGSGGDAKAVESAKKGLIGAIIGLVVIVLAYTFVAFILEKIG